MRRLILVLAFLIAPLAFSHEQPQKHTHAKAFKNNVGGLTVITDRTKRCGSLQAFDGYAFSAAGDKAKFCWVPRGDVVLVMFEGERDTGMWPMSAFEDLEVEPDLSILFPEDAKDI